MSYALGTSSAATGDPYIIGQPGRAGDRLVWGRRAAIHAGEQLARSTGRMAHVYAVTGRPGHIGFTKGRLVVKIAPRRRYAYKASMMGLGDNGDGLGQTLTDWACEEATFARNWTGRLDTALDTATIAAVIGASAAGFLGALIGRPLLGAGAGALTGWAAAAIWTGPQRP